MKKILILSLTLLSLVSFAGDVFTPAAGNSILDIQELCAGYSNTFGYKGGTQVGEILKVGDRYYGVCKRQASEYGYFNMSSFVVTPVRAATYEDAVDYCRTTRSETFGLAKGFVVGKTLYTGGYAVVACMRKYRF